MTSMNLAESDDKTARILDVTERLIVDRGYDAVRLFDIADGAGVSIGTLQHRYRSKEALMLAAAQRIGDTELASNLTRIEGLDDAWDQLRTLLQWPSSSGSMTPASMLWLELLVASLHHPNLLAIMQSHKATWAEVVTNCIQNGLDTGRFNSALSAVQLTRTLLSMSDGMVLTHALEPEGPHARSDLLLLERAARTILGLT